jgi:hypothetical protein
MEELFMFKRILLLGLTTLAISTQVMAIGNSIIRTNILADISGIPGFEYEYKISDHGAVSLDYWGASSSGSLSSTKSNLSNIRVLYREYENSNQTGLFYGVGASYLTASYSEFQLLDKSHSAIGVDLKLGLQGRINNNIVASLSAGFIYFVTAVEKTKTNGFRTESVKISGILPNIGLNIGYNF